MKRGSKVFASVATLLCLASAFAPSPASACSACFGKSDGPLAAGMNWGIFSLLAVIVSVLGGIGGFFVYLAKKSAAMAQAAEATKAAGDAADYHESLTRDGALEVHPTETEHELAGAPD